MKPFVSVVSLLLIITAIALAQKLPPQLSQSFSADAIVEMPMIGKVPAKYYYDYANQRDRMDVSMFGQTVIGITLVQFKSKYQIDPTFKQCKVEPYPDELFPMFIPPIAVYKGEEYIDGQVTEKYELNWFGAGDLVWNAQEINTTSEKSEWVLRRFSLSQDITGFKTVFDMKNVVSGPQSDDLFDISKYNCQKPVPPKVYTVKGYLRNAVNNELIGTSSTASVELRSRYDGNTIKATIEASGLFVANSVPSGSYTLKATVTEFIDGNKTLEVENDIAEGSLADLFLSPKLNAGQFRAVLTWAANPQDLDAHMFVPGRACEVSFKNKKCSGSYGAVQLDYDVTKGYGPETVTLNQISGGDFVYFVYIYSSGTYPDSQAKVKLYSEQGLIREFTVPTTGYDSKYRIWKVFSVNGNTKEITSINQVVSA